MTVASADGSYKEINWAPRDSCAMVASGVGAEEGDFGAFRRSRPFRVFSTHLQADSAT
jgi:hypothetical protein